MTPNFLKFENLIKQFVIITIIFTQITSLSLQASEAQDMSLNNQEQSKRNCSWFCNTEQAKKSDVESIAIQNIINAPLTQEQEELQQQALRVLSGEMTARLSEVENILKLPQDGLDITRLNHAVALSQSIWFDILKKIGIDPSVKLREKFLVPIQFPDGAQTMGSLTEDQQEAVIKTVQQFRGGLYLNLKNLAKRATLMAIKARYLAYVNSGLLEFDDRDKLLKALAEVSAVPMPIQDKAKKTIIVYEDDIVRDFHGHDFNREILMFIKAAPDLKISVADFIKYRNEFKPDPKNQSARMSNEKANECMANANLILNHEDKADATVKCFDKFLGQFNSFAMCHDFAMQVLWNTVKASRTKLCFEKFNN